MLMSAEAELVAGLRAKDPAAFERLIREHGTKLYRVASRMVGSHEAEEVLQDTLLTVVEKIDGFQEHSALGTWLYRVAVNTALMRLRSRSRSREQPVEPEDLEFTEDGMFRSEVSDWAIPPEDAVLRQETRHRLQ